jgi:cob(I)alamin adenosyltransferase
MRITKVYTRKGDKGSTSLADGTRIAKDDLRLEAYGTVDELSSQFGIARGIAPSAGAEAAHERLLEPLRAIQNQLFTLAGDLATPLASRPRGMPLIEAADIAALERLIDRLNGELPPLADFVLAGPPPLAAQLHVARCVCRRAERRTQALAGREDLGPHVVPYLNRLSDLLFVMARWITRQVGEREPIWDRELARPQWPERD